MLDIAQKPKLSMFQYSERDFSLRNIQDSKLLDKFGTSLDKKRILQSSSTISFESDRLTIYLSKYVILLLPRKKIFRHLRFPISLCNSVKWLLLRGTHTKFSKTPILFDTDFSWLKDTKRIYKLFKHKTSSGRYYLKLYQIV